MKKLALAFSLLVSSLYASELVLISNDTTSERLESLHQKYAQEILINNGHVYLISSECTIERYYGGTSQGQLNLVEAPTHTQDIPVTQEVFEAKDAKVITQKIELDKSIALVEGKVSKEFLADQEGRAFGGASELPRDMSAQRREVQKTQMIVNEEPAEDQKVPIQTAKTYTHPTCQLLEDGSGYQLLGITDAKFYSKNGLTPISSPTILFK